MGFAHDDVSGVNGTELAAFKASAPNIVKDNCMKEGITLGRSVAFITAVMCEMLRAYTVRSTRPAWEVFNRNKWMHLACSISFICTVSLTLLPGVKTIFKLDTPDWWFCFLSFLFAFGCTANDELFKYFYRKKIAGRAASRKQTLEKKDAEERIENLIEMVHDINSARVMQTTTNVEMKESLTEIKDKVATLADGTGVNDVEVKL